MGEEHLGLVLVRHEVATVDNMIKSIVGAVFAASVYGALAWFVLDPPLASHWIEMAAILITSFAIAEVARRRVRGRQ
jgi:hypothetical protein